MHYIRQQILITTISDEEIKDTVIIKSLFKKIHEASADIVLEYRDSNQNIKKYDKVRVIEVKEDTISIQAFQKSGTLKVSDIKYEDIFNLKLVTSKHNIVSGVDKISRFDLIDIE